LKNNITRKEELKKWVVYSTKYSTFMARKIVGFGLKVCLDDMILMLIFRQLPTDASSFLVFL